MLVRSKLTDDPHIDLIHGAQVIYRVLDAFGREVIDRAGLQYLYYPSSISLVRHEWFQSADIVQLYNLHGGYFSYRSLPALSRRRPIVWRLSDMWPLTGHCSYSYDCTRWQTGCGSCPYLDVYPALSWDSTALLWRVKQIVYRRSRLVIVTTNRWMDGIVKNSPLLGHFPRHIIPNGVNANIFRPISRASACEVLGLDAESDIILFTAQVAKEGTRKGGEFAIPVLEQVATNHPRPITLVVMGEGADGWPDGNGYRTHRLGYTHSDQLLAAVYAAADVTIFPALAENLPNVILESMSSGTPAVAFDVGGVSDVVRHMETGYLARYRDLDDLISGTAQLLNDKDLRARLSASSRDLITNEYSDDLQVSRFVNLYESILDAGIGIPRDS